MAFTTGDGFHNGFHDCDSDGGEPDGTAMAMDANLDGGGVGDGKLNGDGGPDVGGRTLTYRELDGDVS